MFQVPDWSFLQTQGNAVNFSSFVTFIIVLNILSTLGGVAFRVQHKGFITRIGLHHCGGRLSKCKVPRAAVRKGVSRLEPHGQELKLAVHQQATIPKEDPEEKSAIADPAAVWNL